MLCYVQYNFISFLRSYMLSIVKDFTKILKGSLFDLIPILWVISFFQLVIFREIPENIEVILLGIITLWLWLGVFLLGLQYGIFPIWEKLTESFIKKSGRFWLYIFGFLIGFGTTIAEPALSVVSLEAAEISNGRVDPTLMRYLIAFSVGFALVVGIWRIISGFPLHYMILGGYIIVVILTFFTPSEIVGLSYDLGGVVAADVTVPLVAALGIWLASRIPGRSPVLDGFGIIALASLTPMIFAQFYGIYIYTFGSEGSSLGSVSSHISESFVLNFETIITGLLDSFFNILPLIWGIFFFQYLILREKIPFWELKKILLWLLFVILGLYAFVTGLQVGIIQIGEEIAFQLTQMSSESMIYIFAFSIGFSTTMAEPSLIAIANKAREISSGRIQPLTLRIAVALWVALGITLGAHRIIVGDSIQYYIMFGYIIAIILTLFAPKYIMPIAYDSGGVTTSTVSVPLITALGIWLASNIPGRNPMIDGFWLIAFASLFPMITVIIYAIYGEYKKVSLSAMVYEKIEITIESILHKPKHLYSQMLGYDIDKNKDSIK